MGLFDPPPVKIKKFARPRYILPQGANKSVFLWLYWGTIFMWVILFITGGSVLMLVFPAIFNYYPGWKLWLSLEMFLAGLGWFFGGLMASAVVKELIKVGVAEGDVKVEMPQQQN